jgi:hypothetical protein
MNFQRLYAQGYRLIALSPAPSKLMSRLYPNVDVYRYTLVDKDHNLHELIFLGRIEWKSVDDFMKQFK